MEKVVEEVKVVDEKLDDYLQRYAKNLCSAHMESDQQRNFRLGWPKRFLQLCKFHLSVLVQVPTDFFNEYQLVCGDLMGYHSKPQQPATPLDCSGVNGSQFKRQALKSWQVMKNIAFGGAFGVTESCPQSQKCNDVATWKNITSLMDLIDNEENLRTEGIFRKSGNALRVRAIRQCLNEELPLQTPTHACVHDLASALKGALTDMEEPVLTKVLVPLFRQVGDLTLGQLDEKGQRVARRPIEQRLAVGKQLMSLRLLCLLMPEKHRDLLQQVLQLLRNVVKYSDKNRLTADTLGIIFAPVLLSPKEAPATEMQLQQGQLASLTTIMINEGVEGLWQMPLSFANDIDRILLDLQHGDKRNGAEEFDSDELDTTVLVEANTATDEPDQELGSKDSGIDGTDGSQNGEVDTQNQATLSRGAPPSTIKFAPVLRKVKIRSQKFDDDEEDLTKEDDPMVTCLRFAKEVVDIKDESVSLLQSETEMALRKLYQSIQALPDKDRKKARLIKRFNKTNAGLPRRVGTKPRKPIKVWGSKKSNRPSSVTKLSASPANRFRCFQYANVRPDNVRSSLGQILPVCGNQTDGGCRKLVFSATGKIVGQSYHGPVHVTERKEDNVSLSDDGEAFLASRASVVDRTGNDWLLCCPIPLLSPFKRDQPSHWHSKCASQAASDMTLMKKYEPEQYEASVCIQKDSVSKQYNRVDNDHEDHYQSPDMYFPIVMPDMYPLRQLMTQTERQHDEMTATTEPAVGITLKKKTSLKHEDSMYTQHEPTVTQSNHGLYEKKVEDPSPDMYFPIVMTGIYSLPEPMIGTENERAYSRHDLARFGYYKDGRATNRLSGNNALKRTV